MPNCKRCHKPVDGTPYCPWCGTKQSAAEHKPKTRGNGQGTAYKVGRTWQAEVVIGWRTDAATGARKRVRR